MKIPTFLGYRRENKRVGVRNHVIILPVDDISNAACEAVANNIKGTLALPHAYGRLQFGEDLELFFRTMIGTGANPNVAAVDRHRHRAGLDEAHRRRHREDRQARRGLLHRAHGDIQTIADASRQGEGVRAVGERAAAHELHVQTNSTSPSSAASPTRPPACRRARRSAT